MITIYLKGGLGNIFFQYAAGRSLAIRNNTALCLNLSHYISLRDLYARKLVNELGHFRLSAELLVPSALGKVMSCIGIGRLSSDVVYREKNFGYDPSVMELGDESKLDGYFQSEEYFKGLEEVIRTDLQLRVPLSDKVVSSNEEKISSLNSVAIHIRRGDYLKKPLHNICTEDYYENSIEYIRKTVEDPRFFVFSDDIEWCRSNMKSDEYCFVDSGITKQRLGEFHLMSRCKHIIISNSSFSWWAAWLNNNPEKIVVCPNRWFGDDAMNEQAVEHTIPDSWVRINV